ncbi:MAG TPA: hypothetical protein VKQ11_07585 [Candidatus Sulfotelmatobacter sp.]|nr:hypothetical protein [Candidatus Sulfotelmatobacter sp.]
MSLQRKIGQSAAVLVLLLAALGLGAQAQVLNSGASTITLQAVLNDSISVSLSGNAVNFTLTPGSASNPGSLGITATTAWALKPSVGSVKVYAFFSNSASALTDGAGDTIPSADFELSDNAGPFTALTSTVPFGGANAGLQVSNTKILGNNRSGSHTDVMNFNINLSTVPSLPAGNYTGTLTIQAQAI